MCPAGENRTTRNSCRYPLLVCLATPAISTTSPPAIACSQIGWKAVLLVSRQACRSVPVLVASPIVSSWGYVPVSGSWSPGAIGW